MQQNPPNRKTPNLRRALPEYSEGPQQARPQAPGAAPYPGPQPVAPAAGPPRPTQVPVAQAAPAVPSTSATEAARAAYISATPLDSTLKVDSILTQEFMHASGSAHQLRDHSNTLFNFFLLASGALSTGLGVIVNIHKNGGASATLEFLQVLLLSAGAVLAFVIFIRFFKLAKEYRQSLITLNLIRQFYIAHLRREMPEIDRAFRSRDLMKEDTEALSTNNLLGLTIAGLGSLAAAGAMGHFIGWIALLNHRSSAQFGGQFIGLPPVVWEVLVFALAFGAQVQYFRKYLQKPPETM